MASPIQIVLNPENYEEARATVGGGPRKDFFANHDREFREHKVRIINQLTGVAETLSAQSQTDIGYLKVILRRSAWAKSHRPLTALFKPKRTPLVGGGDLGVMIFEVSPTSIAQVADDVRRAEDYTTLRYVETLGKEVPYPSAARSETGAIERIEIYGPSDKRAFSLDQAIAWLSNPLTGSSYEVELFEAPPPHSALDAYDRSHQRLFQSFVDGLSNARGGVTVQRLLTRARSQPLISIRLDQSGEPALVRLVVAPHTDRRRSIAPFDPSSARHSRLLHFFGRSPACPARVVARYHYEADNKSWPWSAGSSCRAHS